MDGLVAASVIALTGIIAQAVSELKKSNRVMHQTRMVPLLTNLQHSLVNSGVVRKVDALMESALDVPERHPSWLRVDTPRPPPEPNYEPTPAPPARPRHIVEQELRAEEATATVHVTVAAPPVPEPEPVVEDDELPVFFKRGEPTTFDTFGSQHKIIDYLQHAVAGLQPYEMALSPVILLGPPGLGKTTLAKVTANELRLRADSLGLSVPEFIEVFPADVPTVQALDSVMRRVRKAPGSVLFIDEIHDVENDRHWRKLYLFLQDGRYKFEDERNPVVMPPTTVLAATTDYGRIHEALLRRFTQKMLEPATPDELKVMVQRRPFPISEPAVDLIVSRCGASGTPWEVLEVYEEAVVYARGTKRDGITTKQVMKVFETQGIDVHGLRAVDRLILEVLFQHPRTRNRRGGTEAEFVCYGLAEGMTTALARVDKEYYRESIRPRLMSRGLLEIRPTYGQALTERAVELYGNLRDTGANAGSGGNH